jgi:hypothetical protein
MSLKKFDHSKVLAFAFGLSAEIGRNLIARLTKEALLPVFLACIDLPLQSLCKNIPFEGLFSR